MLLVVARPDLYRPLLMITNDETATRSKARFLSQMLRAVGARIPVASGLPSLKRRADDLAERSGLVEPGGDFRTDGVACLAEVLDRHAQVDYFGLGALTNLAAVLAQNPHLAPRIRLFQMGPALAGAYPRKRPQFNARIDPAAFRAVVTAVPHPHLVMSHTTWATLPGGRVRLGLYPDDPAAEALRRSERPVLRLLARQLEAFVASGKDCSILHDPLTVLSARHQGLVDWAEVDLVLRDDGWVDLTPEARAQLRSLGARSQMLSAVLDGGGAPPGATIPVRLSLAADYQRARRLIFDALLGAEAGADQSR